MRLTRTSQAPASALACTVRWTPPTSHSPAPSGRPSSSAAARSRARELAELYLQRIDRYDGDLNAYRVTFDERALAEADQADARAKGGDTRPLLGVRSRSRTTWTSPASGTSYGGDANDGPAPPTARSSAACAPRAR